MFCGFTYHKFFYDTCAFDVIPNFLHAAQALANVWQYCVAWLCFFNIGMTVLLLFIQNGDTFKANVLVHLHTYTYVHTSTNQVYFGIFCGVLASVMAWYIQGFLVLNRGGSFGILDHFSLKKTFL